MMAQKLFSKILPAAAAFVLCLLVLMASAPCEGCFTIVVGRDASADGFVIMAHNEDDGPPQIVNHHKVPRRKYPPGEKVKLINGGQLNQLEETWAYIWSEMPGMLFSDSYINEWGVSIASDNCPSREDQPQITDGGITYMLRRLVAERAKTAREGVLLAGRLVERFGYGASGRTYIICDPNEGWLFCAINGKHWLAQRVPDNQVAMVANTFTVRKVDLADKDHFIASTDIVKYAVSRGWYTPEQGRPFDFAAVYANPKSASSLHNLGRQWSALRHIAVNPIPLGPELPFSVVPRRRLDVPAVMKILRDHYEGTKLYQSPFRSHKNSRSICDSSTQTSFIVQLRGNIPLDIGIVYWTCLAPPCTSFYVPFHFGTAKFPAGFSSESLRPSHNFYRQKVRSPFQADPLHAFWTFSNFHSKVDNDYGNRITAVKARIQEIEKRALALQKPLEETARRLYSEDKTAAMQMLANYSNGIYLSTMKAMDAALSQN